MGMDTFSEFMCDYFFIVMIKVFYKPEYLKSSSTEQTISEKDPGVAPTSKKTGHPPTPRTVKKMIGPIKFKIGRGDPVAGSARAEYPGAHSFHCPIPSTEPDYAFGSR